LWLDAVKEDLHDHAVLIIGFRHAAECVGIPRVRQTGKAG